jgi:predicted PurR-regulated permease PerM
LLAISAALGIAAFYFLARWLARRRPALRPWVVAASVGLLVLLSFQPIYGGGENLMTPAGKFTDAYTAYRKELLRSTAR